MSDLQSVFSDNDPEHIEQERQPEQAQPVQQKQAPESTGEQQAAPPAEQSQEAQEAAPDEPQQRQKGLEAALLAERRRRQELEQLIRQSQQQAPQPAAQAAAPDGLPDPANYQGNEQQYWRDLARFEARQELLEYQKQAQRYAEQESANKRIAATQEKLAAAVLNGQSKYRDFDAVINGGLAPFLNDALREEIATSELGDDVAYYLGKNPAEAARLAGLSDPRALAREMVRLESKVKAPAPINIPQTLTQARDSRGQYQTAAYDGPTPLDAVLARK
jgi:hypothetical protein